MGLRMRLKCEYGEARKLIRELLTLASQYNQKTPTHDLQELKDQAQEFCEAYFGAWKQFLGHSLNKQYKTKWIVEQAYYGTFSRWQNQKQKETFYRAHNQIIGSVLQDVIGRLEQTLSKTDCPEMEQQLRRASASLLSDLTVGAVELAQSYATEAGIDWGGKPPILALGNVDHHLTAYGFPVNVWYGNFIQNTWGAVPALRTVLEMRIRHGVNVIGVEVNGQLRKVTVPQILDALRNEKEAKCSVEWIILKNIYRWANLYVHIGYNQYPWLAGYALKVVEPLIVNTSELTGGPSANAGIQFETNDALVRVLKSIGDMHRKSSSDNIRIKSIGGKPRSEILTQ